MEYYLALAREQYERFLAFVEAHPEMNVVDRRIAFYGQRYEVHISHSISQGIHAYTNPDGTPK